MAAIFRFFPRALFTRQNLFFILATVFIFLQPRLHAGSMYLQAAQASPTPPSASPDDVTELVPGQKFERTISAGEKHIYQLTLAADQVVRAEVRDHGTDVGVWIHTPNRDPDVAWKPAGEVFDVKPVSFLAEVDGVYRVEVYASQRAKPGKYEITLLEIRAAGERDRALHGANKLFAEAVDLRKQGKIMESRQVVLRCLEIRLKYLGEDNMLVANTLAYLSTNYDETGDYANAEAADLRNLRIKEKLIGPNHPDIAHVLMGMGVTYRNRGDYVRAEEVQLKALTILEKNNQIESFTAGGVLENLASTYLDEEQYAKAEAAAERAKAIWEKMLGQNHFHIAPSYTFLGHVAYFSGNYAKAEQNFQKALSLSEAGLGSDSLNVSNYRNNLAMVYCTTGDYAKGEALYKQVLDLHEQKEAMSSTSVQDTLFGLARCYAAQGEIAQAIKFQAQAGAIQERYIAVNLAVGSEREKRAFLDRATSRSSRNISLHAQAAPNDPAALELAVTTVLQNKGRVQDAMSAGLERLRRHLTGEDQKLLDQLNASTTKLATLVLNGPQKVSVAEHENQIKALEKQREQLEDQINRLSAGYYSSQPVTPAAVQSAIPDDAALLEYAVYRPFNAKAPDTDAAYGKPRYVVYVIRKQGIQWRELGEADELDNLLNRLRAALRDPKRTDVQMLSRAVDKRILQPVRPLLGDVRHLLISPDGELNLVPFEALLDQKNQYAEEKYLISYLTAGRDLLRMQVQRESKSGPVVVADPQFDGPAGTLTARGNSVHLKLASTRSVTRGNDLANVYFAPLQGTLQEARTIQSLFPDAQVLTGTQANKTALTALTAPRLLHIATHGFFLDDSTTKAGTPLGKDSRGKVPAMNRIENPLLRSGLALAGANVHKDQNSSGILTALEASNLNLWGTRLVTLSACETGVGEVHNGEGVYGLRRSFFLAGTDSLVMSLWAVSDQITREMMTAYYQGLKKGLGRAEALRQAELTMLHRKGRRHPFYWASFIESGEWANLDGHR